MTKEEILKKLHDRQELAEQAQTAYQQLQGQIVLLRELLKEFKEDKKEEKSNIEEVK